DEYAHLASRLNGVSLLHTLKGCGNRLKLTQTVEVVLYRIAARARTGGRNSVSRLHDTRFERLVGVFLVVGLHRINHRLGYIVLGQQFHADFHVRAFYLVVHRLSDVVEESALLGDVYVSTNFGGKHTGDMGNLKGVQ